MTIVEHNTLTNLGDNEYELPIGYIDGDGVLHKRFKLREMTGKVDEAIADKKIRSNAGKVVTELIYGVLEELGTLPRIDRNIVRRLSNADRDYIVLMNFYQSIAEEIEYTDMCAVCGSRLQVEVNINNMPVSFMTDDEPRKITITDLPNGFKDKEGNVFKEMTLTFPDGMLQEKIFATVDKNPNQALTQVLAMCTESIKGFQSYNFESFSELSKKDRKYISTKLNEIKVGVELAVDVECPECGAETKSAIPFMTLLGE